MMLESKRAALYQRLRALGPLVVAYSGGVDSACLAWAARQVLGAGMLAVIADSPSLAREQLRDAVAFAAEHDIPLRVVATAEGERPEYIRNDGARCFHCKDELFAMLEPIRAELGWAAVAYGMNCDDQGDFRPGQSAAQQHGVAAPLLEAGLGKQEVRELAQAAGLRLWNKPASACLASRVAYGQPVTPEVLAVVEAAEQALRELGFRQFRVRHHGEIARVEIAAEELQRGISLEMARQIASRLKPLGFKYITLDLEGYRSGSMNAMLPAAELTRSRE